MTVVVGGQSLGNANFHADGTWDIQVPPALALKDGIYDVQATATDQAGNVGTDATTNELLVDMVSPTVTVTSLVTKNNQPKLTGTVTDAAPSSGIAGVTGDRRQRRDQAIAGQCHHQRPYGASGPLGAG